MNPFNRAFRALLLVLGVVFVVMATPTVICAAQGDGGGGGDNTAAILGALYGDLYILERDGNGEPFVYEDGACTGCLQPIAANCSYVPLMCHGMTGAPQVPGLPEDEEEDDPCEIDMAAIIASQDPGLLPVEVHFGRLSVARVLRAEILDDGADDEPSSSVVDSAYVEALNNINGASNLWSDPDWLGDGLWTDPAGRFVLELPLYELVFEENPETGGDFVEVIVGTTVKTIDAPLENLALYRRLMIDGCLAPVTITKGLEVETVELSTTAHAMLAQSGFAFLSCPEDGGLPDDITDEDISQAASLIAAAADKSDFLRLDTIINVNTYLGINPIQIDYVGQRPSYTLKYFDFGEFTYDRDLEGQTAWLLEETQLNYFLSTDLGLEVVDLQAVNLEICSEAQPLETDCSYAEAPDCGGANFFAQQAEDARKTIWFLHNWSVPEIAY